MGARIRKWGNSLGVTIPKAILDQVVLKEGEMVDFQVEDNRIIICKGKYNLDDLLAQITPENLHGEIDPDEPLGRELI